MATALIVDDHPENVYLLRSLLQGNGYDVVTAADGRQALDEARRRVPDLVISDILMPVMDGFALCREWKQDDALKAVPFVFYTATYTDARDEALAKNLGADLFLVKPLEPEEFLRRVAEVLARHARGQLAAAPAPPVAETTYLRGYNEALIRKLEDKVADLEQANRALRVKDFAIESASSGIAILDLDGRVSSVNPSLAALVGRSREEIVGGRFEALFPAAATNEDIRKSLEAGRPWTGELSAGADPVQGRGRTLEGAVDLVRDASGAPLCWLASFADTTDRRRALEELQRSQRLQSLTLFAGGIAHDFNNLLTGLFGNIELARGALDSNSPALPYLATVNRAFERARDLTRRLLTFSKGTAPVRRPHDVLDLLRDCCALSLSGSNVRWELNTQRGIAPVLGDADQLSQVFTNVVVNARQAMPSGGTLTIAVKNRDVAPAELGDARSGSWVEIAITDEGTGIAPEVLPRLFEPFFTTKSGGSGLGLAMAYSIVECHGGHIAAASRPGGGATFTVWLPAAEAMSADVEPKPVRIAHAAVPGRVLVMDDERIIREMAAKMLQQHGYQVTASADGAQAVDEYARALRSGQRFDVVILDLTVRGGMGGEEALDRLARIDPGAAVILSSGYGREAEIRGDFRPRAILPKPYQRHELLGCVTAVMSASRGA